MNTQPVPRRYDLDWLRVLGILSVFLFHTSRFFDLGDWHVKNATRYLGVQLGITVVSSWLMPLMFVISGASLYYGLRKGATGKFIQDKVLRLLVPWAVGILTHASIQVYLDRVTAGRFSGSYFEFLPHYFTGLDLLGGNMPWTGMHLWYLVVLFIFTLAFLPLFRWLKDGSGRRILDAVGSFLARPGAAFLLALPTLVLLMVIDPNSALGNWENGGWNYLLYTTFFLGGFVIIAHDGLQRRIQSQRWLSLVSGLILITAGILVWRGNDPAFASPRFVLIHMMWGLSAWCFLMAILGFGLKHLTFSTPFLNYANEAVLPFYVMHQTVLLVVGYFVLAWEIPDLVKFGLIAVIAFAVIAGLYDLAVRRLAVLRFLFGMKPKARRVIDARPLPAGQEA